MVQKTQDPALKSLFVRMKLCLAKGENLPEVLTVPPLAPDAYFTSIDLLMRSAEAYKSQIEKYENSIRDFKVGPRASFPVLWGHVSFDLVRLEVRSLLSMLQCLVRLRSFTFWLQKKLVLVTHTVLWEPHDEAYVCKHTCIVAFNFMYGRGGKGSLVYV